MGKKRKNRSAFDRFVGRTLNSGFLLSGRRDSDPRPSPWQQVSKFFADRRSSDPDSVLLTTRFLSKRVSQYAGRCCPNWKCPSFLARIIKRMARVSNRQPIEAPQALFFERVNAITWHEKLWIGGNGLNLRSFSSVKDSSPSAFDCRVDDKSHCKYYSLRE